MCCCADQEYNSHAVYIKCNYEALRYNPLLCSTMSQLPAEILLSIIQASNLPMLYVWGLVCKVIRCFVAGELDTRHHRFLKPFISDIELFMNTLRLHGGIVAGSVALAYLEGARWKPNNCDIYLPYFGVHRFLAYLEMAEGYTVVEEGPEVEKVQVMIEGAQENDNSSVCGTFN